MDKDKTKNERILRRIREAVGRADKDVAYELAKNHLDFSLPLEEISYLSNLPLDEIYLLTKERSGIYSLDKPEIEAYRELVEREVKKNIAFTLLGILDMHFLSAITGLTNNELEKLKKNKKTFRGMAHPGELEKALLIEYEKKEKEGL
ncbi:hypothetical protein JQN58_01535 [Aneurinibacillus sp. BA2021]|nr:hypothetical protein [Aneurinibacillus sp. BA2021]